MFPIWNSSFKTFNRRFMQFSTKVYKQQFPNPGVDARLRVLEPDKEELMDPEFMEEAEASFWNVGEMHKEYQREESHYRELKGFHQVNRKFFKEEKSPNMLMWEEKQHIRSLHEQDPELWTIAKLSISFPASPSIIEKLLKAKWKLQTPQDIARHDSAVHRNWEKLRAGKLDVPNADLKEHLLRFSHRRKIPNTTVTVCSKTDAEVQSGVFSAIINSHTNIEGASQTSDRKTHIKEENASTLKNSPQNNKFFTQGNLIDAKRYKTSTTLDSLCEKVLERELKGGRLNEVEKAIIHNVNKDKVQKLKPFVDPIGVPPQSGTSSTIALKIEETRTEFLDLDSADMIAEKDGIVTTKRKETEKCVSKFNSSLDESALKNYASAHIDHYPLKIEIPEDKRRKGFIYRVKDRFYADDGEFLYRVPGLSKE